MSWTAIVPIKEPGRRKTRLVPMKDDVRLGLTERMLAHVLAVLNDHPRVAHVFLLAKTSREGLNWIPDRGRGLNAELQAALAAMPQDDLLIIHADLPLLDGEDISAMLDTAERNSAAIAPDRHGRGTNALALKAGLAFSFQFGPDSRHRHESSLPRDVVVERSGLASDIDTPEDIMVINRLLPQGLFLDVSSTMDGTRRAKITPGGMRFSNRT